MVEVRWTLQAAEDLHAIAEFVALDSPHYASLLAVDIVAAAERLADFPLSGRIVPELGRTDVREILSGNYRLIYRVRETLVEILTVCHTRRLLDDPLKE